MSHLPTEAVMPSRRSQKRRANAIDRLIKWHYQEASRNAQLGRFESSLGATDRLDHRQAASWHRLTAELLKELT